MARKRSKNLALSDMALALARDRPGGGRRRRSPLKFLLLLATAGAAAAAFLNRDKVAGLLRPGSEESGAQDWTPAPPPAPSNYDAPGPVANTATPVPAPEPVVRTDTGAIDEEAEVQAAAAEAANIGGPGGGYAPVLDETSSVAGEAERPLAEAGEGTSEGQEQAEADLAEAAEPTAPGLSDAERQIDDTIAQAGRPSAGETLEPTSTPAPPRPSGPADRRRFRRSALQLGHGHRRARPRGRPDRGDDRAGPRIRLVGDLDRDRRRGRDHESGRRVRRRGPRVRVRDL